MTLATLPSPNFTGADLSARVNAALAEARASRRFATVAALLNDASMAYGSGARSVAAGDIVEAGGHRYEVAASGATDHQLATAGGIRLRVLPAPDGTYNFAAMAPAADGVTDDFPRLRLLLDAVLTGTGAYRSGPALFLPNGRYFMGQTIELKEAVRLMGNASGLPYDSGPELIFPANTSGIIVHRYNTIGAGLEASPTFAADASIIEGIKLSSAMGTDRSRHGIWLRARAVVRNVLVSGFPGNGVHIVASAGGGAAVEGNANSWRLDTLRIQGCGAHGLFVDGADANAGTAIGVDVSNNGRCGIWDSSFLGNCYVGCHADANGLASLGGNAADQSSVVAFGGSRYAAHPDATEAQLAATQPGTNAAVWVSIGAGGVHPNIPLWTAGKLEGTYFRAYAYRSDDLNARNVFLGCYTEGGAAGGAFRGPALVLGGLMEPIIQGDQLRNDVSGNLTAATIGADLGAVSARLGGQSEAALLFQHDSEGADPWRLQYDAGNWLLRHANSNNRIAMAITTGQSTWGTGPYVATFPTLGVGFGLGARCQAVSTAAPTSGAWAQGDIVWNSGATAGGFAGWICTTGGTPGTWKTFGAIAA